MVLRLLLLGSSGYVGGADGVMLCRGLVGLIVDVYVLQGYTIGEYAHVCCGRLEGFALFISGGVCVIHLNGDEGLCWLRIGMRTKIHKREVKKGMFLCEKIVVCLWLQVAVAVSNMEKDDCETF